MSDIIIAGSSLSDDTVEIVIDQDLVTIKDACLSSELSASNSVTTASEQATIATTQAGIATTKASEASASATNASTYATDSSNSATASASSASASASSATDSATQAGLATTAKTQAEAARDVITGMTVATGVAGSLVTWDGVTGTLTVPRGDTGADLTMTSVVNNLDGTYTWNFSDSTSFTTGNIVGATGATGPQGEQGIQGTAGNTWYYGTTDPTNEGVNGDFYLNTATYYYFIKQAGTWISQHSLKGIQGDIGPQGIQGEVGPQGIQGVAGNDIDHITLKTTVGKVKTYELWADAGETISMGTFDVTDGADASATYDQRDYVSTSGQTVFNINYSGNLVEVYINGIKLQETVDYTTDASGTFITLTSGANLNNVVQCKGFGTAGAVSSGIGDIGTNESIAIGTGSGGNNDVGLSNVSVGENAGSEITTGGDYNVLIGFDAGKYVTTSNGNVGLGSSALQGNSTSKLTGGYNVGVGSTTGLGLTTGSNNIMIGQNAGYQLTSGGHNVFIGTNAGALGDVFTTESHKFVLSGYFGTFRMMVGDFSTQDLTINAKLNLSNVPTSSSGLSSGDIWNDAGTLKIV